MHGRIAQESVKLIVAKWHDPGSPQRGLGQGEAEDPTRSRLVPASVGSALRLNQPTVQSEIFSPIRFISSRASALPLASSTGWCVWAVLRRCLKVWNVSRTSPL